MLNIDIKIYGNKKDNISEEEFKTFFNRHIDKVYVTGEVHSAYQI